VEEVYRAGFERTVGLAVTLAGYSGDGRDRSRRLEGWTVRFPASPRSDGNAETKGSSRPKPHPGRKEDAPPTKRVGRPRAKHSNPDYTQMSVYIPKDVRAKVKVRLFETGGEFSGLVEALLREWLVKQK
jgi:hypothetical protein